MSAVPARLCAAILWIMLAVGTATAAMAQEPGARPPELTIQGDWCTDSQGHTFRCRFDMGNRLTLGAGWSGRTDMENGALSQDAIASDAFASFSVHLRHGCAHERENCWKLSHTLFETSISPAEAAASGWPVMHTRLFSGNYERYLASPFITVPTNPPHKLPFPFNFGVSVDFAGLDVPASDSGASHAWDVEVVDTRLVLGLLRTRSLRNTLQLGAGIRYDIQISDPVGEASPVLEHRLSPFTATSLFFSHETVDGLTRVTARADVLPILSDTRGWSVEYEAQASFERVLIAVNDLPLSVSTSVRYANTPSVKEIVGLCGVVLSL